MPLPETLRPTWEALYNEVVAVHARWMIYRQLFAQSEERIGILNACAANFFYFIHETLLNDVQLTLSKLADPATTSGRTNATLQRLVNEIMALNEPTLTDKLSKLLAEYIASCQLMKIRRNKQIAHYDHATLPQQYGSSPADVLGPSRQEIEDALAALRRFMEHAEVYFTSSSTAYQEVISQSDAEALMSVLQRGCAIKNFRKPASFRGMTRNCRVFAHN
jgi:HEPN superfamily AbiU2-like protein